MRNTSRVPRIAVALLGACVADDGDQIEVDSFTATIQRDPAGGAEVQREAIRLYEDLAARLDENARVLAVGALVGGGVVCGLSHCRWDSGPRIKQP